MPDEPREMTLQKLVDQLRRQMSTEEFTSFTEMVSATARDERALRADPDRVTHLYDLYRTEHVFAAGQLVRWKRGLKNKRLPDYDTPCVVLDTLDPPVVDATEAPGSAYFRERLDIVVGILDEDGQLDAYHFDSRRFEPYE